MTKDMEQFAERIADEISDAIESGAPLIGGGEIEDRARAAFPAIGDDEVGDLNALVAQKLRERASRKNAHADELAELRRRRRAAQEAAS